MSFHVFWPATTCLTAFVVGVIIIILKYGDSICGAHRRRYMPKFSNDETEVAYAREVSESVA